MAIQRGAICLALYPFTPGLPLDLVLREAEAKGDLNAKIESYDSIEAVARITRRELVVEFKLRPVLLLQGGTSERRPDMLVATINSITDEHRSGRENWVKKLENNIHPIMVMVGHEVHHGLKRVSYTNLSTVQPVNKQAILRKLGQLTDDEMAEVSERLIRALEIDVSGYVAQLSPSREESSPSEPERPS
ncbi:MAG TPA: type II toxin-antitoxin system PemK/MazF family toxin [Gaiellaceae bacterium]